MPPQAAAPPNALDLSGSESPFGCSERAARLAAEALSACQHDSRTALRDLRAILSRRYSFSSTRISVAAGTRALLPALLAALAGEDGGVVLDDRAPPLHRLAVRHCGLHPCPVRTRGGADGWIETLQSTGVRVALLAHPGNPSGASFGREEMQAIVAAAQDAGACLVVDEAYADYASAEFPRVSAWLDDYPGLVVARTFSSLHGLAGLPAAYALSSPEVAARLAPRLLGAEPGEVAARAAATALEDTAFEAAAAECVRRARFRLWRALEAWPVEAAPGQGPWITVRVADAAGAAKRLAARGVLVRDVSAWGWEGRLRIRAGREEEVERFLEAAKPVLLAP